MIPAGCHDDEEHRDAQMMREAWEAPEPIRRRWSARRFLRGMPPLSRGIFLATIAAFVAQIILKTALGAKGYEGIVDTLGLMPDKMLKGLYVWQLVTYLFLHSLDSPFHIFFNMFIFAMFAPEVERALGRERFGILYFGCGIVAAVISCIVMSLYGEGDITVIGASGAILGVLAAYGSLFPDRIVRLLMLFPMKAKHLVWLIAGLEVLSMFFAGQSDVAYITHVGGLAAGFLFIRYRWALRGITRRRVHRRNNRARESDRQIRERVDQLLAKVNRQGINGLTWRERSFLKRASKRFKKQPHEL